ncbi:hypothetical protein H5410_001431, partial [Solanum commersonii]
MKIMPQRRVVLDRPAIRNIEEQRVPNEPEVEEEKLRDREEFRNKKAETGNESGQQRSNVNWSSFQHKQKRLDPSYSSSPARRNK